MGFQDTPCSSSNGHHYCGTVEVANGDLLEYIHQSAEESCVEKALDPLEIHDLQEDQKRAFEIITSHVTSTLQSRSPPPLYMILYGEGGTGKLRVLQTVTQFFTHNNVRHWLVKGAYTGIAASLIEGHTTHFLSGVNYFGGSLLALKCRFLTNFWESRRYLIIDEMSMIEKRFFVLLERRLSLVRGEQNEQNTFFGGLSGVVMCGDFHQMPPVARRKFGALFYPNGLMDNKHKDDIRGHLLFEAFDTVVILKQQMRVKDPVWLAFLRRLRYGQVIENDLTLLHGLILGNPSTPPIDFSDAFWGNASLVTPRHAVRDAWNRVASQMECQHRRVQSFYCRTEESIQGRPLTNEEHDILHSSCNTKHKRIKMTLASEGLMLAVGLKILITSNLCTDLDITNGAKGEITRIILDPEEPAFTNSDHVTLKHLPLCVIVKMERTRAQTLEGLEECEIPVEPREETMMLAHGSDTLKVVRRQFPFTGAYAFTDYRAEGQTLVPVLLDIAKPPSGGMNLFNLYVALSRSAGQDTIRLLRDFDDDMFLKPHDPYLLKEDA